MHILKYTTLFLALSIAITACNSSAPTRVEEDYGNSVDRMIQSQIADPNAAAFPEGDAPDSMDGRKAVKTLREYRGDVADPDDTSKPIEININS
jgi:hypothetical protein